MTIDEFLKQIEELDAKATEGPWLERYDLDYYQAGTYLGFGPEKYVPDKENGGNKRVPCDPGETPEYFNEEVCRIEGTEDDKKFIQQARTILPKAAKVIRLFMQGGGCELPVWHQQEIQKILEGVE